MAADKLSNYKKKRDFKQTQEPSGSAAVKSSNRLRFVIQKHDATRLHYDLRLELDGVFKSWAVTKGPSLDPHDKRLAVEVEDHPLDYGDFEGTIPKGQYGGGTVMLWDRGYWEPEGNKSPEEALKKGDFKFVLHGKRLHGSFVLVRLRNDRDGGKRTKWLLIKHHDEHAVDENGAAILDDNMTSVASGRTMEQIAGGKGRKPKPFMTASGDVEADAVWNSKHGLATDERKKKARKNVAPSTATDLPDFIPPQLCETLERPPAGDKWLHEIKFDGYRIQMRVANGDVTLKTRKGLDWTAKYPEIAEAAASLPDCIIDGEICALDDNGAPDFAALQAALSERNTGNLVYFAFDLLFDGGEDLRDKPLVDRKARLKELLTDATEDPHLRFVEHFETGGDAVLRSACKLSLEGIVSKQADARYQSGRTDTWAKSKCRAGHEVVIGGYPTPELEAVLSKTLGIPLFQESAMKVAMVCAGFTGGEADQLRKSMATFKFSGGVSKFKDKLIAGMVKNGYTEAFAERTFSQLEGFGSYGFPESHAASFALIAYASSWVKCHHPDAFCAALLNSQPMGFYAPAQIVRDAVEHGVEVRPVCINASRWDCTLEDAGEGKRKAVRLGMRMVKGLSTADAARIVAARADEPFGSPDDLWRRSGVPTAALVKLAEADAFLPSLQLQRRDALWALKGLRDEPLELWAAAAEREARQVDEAQEPAVALPAMRTGHEVVEDYSHVGLTLRQHPIAFLREDLRQKRMVTCAEANGERDGRWLMTSGLILVRQRPGSAKGVMFMTLEDETGIVNAVIWPKVFEQQRRLVLSASMLAINGKIQREGEVVHLVAQRLFDLSDDLGRLGELGGPFPLPHGRGDEFAHGNGAPDPRERPKTVAPARDIFIPDRLIDRLKVKSRNFH